MSELSVMFLKGRRVEVTALLVSTLQLKLISIYLRETSQELYIHTEKK